MNYVQVLQLWIFISKNEWNDLLGRILLRIDVYIKLDKNNT